MGLVIRDAGTADEADWRGLWAQYLAFYKVTLSEAVTAHTWARLMDDGSILKARLAILDGRLAGYAIHQHHASTWVAGDDCYLEDLFVAEQARGLGVGRALIEDLRRLAAAKGWHRLYWHTDHDNTRARALYDSFVQADGAIRYRMAV